MNPAIVAYVKLPDQLPPQAAAQLRAAVPYGRRMRLAPEGDTASASLLGMALARVLLAQMHGTSPASIPLQFPYRSKPFSPGRAHFSLSHSGQWLAGIACASARVGLDIEVRTPAAAALAGAGRDLGDWTAREAVVKARGSGLVQINEVQVHEAYCLCQHERWYLMRPAVPAGLIAAVVSEQPLALSVRSLSWESLITPADNPQPEAASA
jgi:phosphopantetheinyl transferase